MDSSVIEDYCRKSGDSAVPDGNTEENEHGFIVWRSDGGAFLIVAAYGDGKYWDKWAENKAKELNMKQIIFATKRNPAAFVRQYGYEVTGYILARPI